MRNVAADPAVHSREQQRFRGVRKRNSGKWVSEIRMPNSRDKIWLGSYPSAEQAARAYDVAAYCIRGPNYNSFNFPALIPPDHPSPLLVPHQIDLDSPISRSLIRDAAASAAASFRLPASTSSLPPSTSINDSFYDTNANARSIPNTAEEEWRSLFTETEDNQRERNLDRVSSLDFPALDDYAWTPVEDVDEDYYDSAELGRLWNI